MRDAVLNLMLVSGGCLLACGLWGFDPRVAMVVLGAGLVIASFVGSVRPMPRGKRR